MRILPGLLLAAAVVFTPFRANRRDPPSQWLSYYPSVVCISGKDVKVQKFAKPSVGENPQRNETLDVAALILPTPVQVKASPSSGS